MLEIAQQKAYNKKQETLKKETENNEKIKEIQELICSEETVKTINKGAQNKHIPSSKGYIEGRSYIFGSIEDAQELVNRYSGTGEIKLSAKGEWTNKEFVVADHEIGVVIDPKTKDGVSTKRFAIHYGKKGTHIVPAKERMQ
ncbi:polymorphic toxin type 50 domain-containing protein [Anaerotignum faecicola]